PMRCMTRSAKMPAQKPATNAASTTIAAMTTVFVLRTDTVGLSGHHDLHVRLRQLIVRAERRDPDRGGDGNRGERHGERAEPVREELRHGRPGVGLAKALADARADPRERERVRLVPQR